MFEDREIIKDDIYIQQNENNPFVRDASVFWPSGALLEEEEEEED